jgi:hypothetical protein
MDSRVRALYKINAQPEGPAQARRIIAEELSAVLSPRELDDVKRVREQERESWGLRLIEQLSDRWGMQFSPQRTEVWFERGCG